MTKLSPTAYAKVTGKVGPTGAARQAGAAAPAATGGPAVRDSPAAVVRDDATGLPTPPVGPAVSGPAALT
eukprot:6911239-Alexandrium_andersonii.AAC.1